MRYSHKINRFNSIMVLAVSLNLVPLLAPYAATCPCDIYQTAGTPCVGAYSTVRQLSSTYTGPLYQVRRSTDQTTREIGVLPGTTVANAAAQDSFLGSGAGTISKLYDQSGKGNDLVKAPGGSANSNTDKESNAKGKSLKINGHTAYALFMGTGEGYRNNKTTGVPTGSAAQCIYAVEDGSRSNVGCCCCFDFGNAETNNQADGTGSMNSLFFGNAYWGKGAGNGPWFMNDMEAGVWAGGSKNGDPGWGALSGTHTPNPKLPSSTWDFAFGLTKTNTTTSAQYAIRVASGSASSSSVNLVTAFDGQAPSTWHMGGALLLGIGGDNSNSSTGTFYEGAFTAGRPSDATDSLIFKNIQDAKYGSAVTTTWLHGNNDQATASLLNVYYNPSIMSAVISYTLKESRRVSISIVDQQGKHVAAIESGMIPVGRHEVVWDAKRVPAGVYICRATIEGTEGWTEKITIQK